MEARKEGRKERRKSMLGVDKLGLGMLRVGWCEVGE